MSKKRARRSLTQDEKTAEAYFRALEKQAFDFLETASPFEISCKLSKHGATTAHRAGIYAILDTLCSSLMLKGEEVSSSDTLARAWRREVEAKGREPEADDMAFLHVASIKFASEWAEERLAQNEARLHALKSELARRDSAEFPATSA